jgi:hypothetical protein
MNRFPHLCWFGCDAQGSVVDLEEMTYAEVLRRFVALTYVSAVGIIDPAALSRHIGKRNKTAQNLGVSHLLQVDKATRGVQLWAELDRNVFSLDRSKRVAYLQRHRDYLIIQRPSADT